MIELPADAEAAADVLIKAFAGRSTRQEVVLPVFLPEEQSDDEMANQPCVVLKAGSLTYGSLPIIGAPRALIARLAATDIANLDQFDIARLRVTEAPWLGGQLAFLPHRKNEIEVPFFVGDQMIVLAGRENSWIYSLMDRRPQPQLDDDLLAYVRFFFTTVVGVLGAFRLADSVDDAIWRQGATEDKKREFMEKLSSLRIAGNAEDGRLELRGTVIFKNALFCTSVMIAPNWHLELTKEELLMEDLPIEFGQKVDLLVRR